jgi:hypothetical protein
MRKAWLDITMGYKVYYRVKGRHGGAQGPRQCIYMPGIESLDEAKYRFSVCTGRSPYFKIEQAVRACW